MSTIALTRDTVTKPGITLVDWRASWCGSYGPHSSPSPAKPDDGWPAPPTALTS